MHGPPVSAIAGRDSTHILGTNRIKSPHLARAGRAAVAVPSPRVGEGAERALASEAGEGFASEESSEETPSPGALMRATLSRQGRG